ncbi:hypothetical protein B0H19DRAFT_1119333 [Mycena capillaripes]|nr:hypothetical protein B0H19DRAFT_1119333 [Mycena capillaripes]
MDSSALLAHIVSQTRQNVEFLISQRQISPENGRDILSKLPNAPDHSIAALERQAQNLLITPPPSTGPMPGYPGAQTVYAKALWGFNEQAQNSNDLSFRAGDTIEIIEETNSDWWTGRHNGRQGLFPSNYVEKLAPSAPSPYQARDTYSSNSSMPSFPSQPGYQPPTGPPSGPPYQPPGPSYQPPPGPSYQPPPGPSYQPPPSSPTGPYSGPGYQPPNGGYQPVYQPPSGPPQQGGQYNSYGGPPPLTPKPAPSQVQAAAPAGPPEPPKKGKFGKLGSTFAQSAVGGAGFGAGMSFNIIAPSRTVFI